MIDLSKTRQGQLLCNRITQLIIPEQVKEVLCLTFLLLLTWLIVPRVFSGDHIISRDHAVHFFQVWDLQNVVLTQGTPWGWSHSWFAGYPVGYFYPFGAYLFVLGSRALSLGMLSLDAAYDLVFGLTCFLNGYAVYLLAKKALNRSVGLMAAILSMSDMGGVDTGGWIWLVFFGVWPISLSIAFSLLAMAQFEQIFSSQYCKALARFGIFSGLALLCHPIAVIHFLLFLPVGWLVYSFLGKAACPLRTQMLRLFLATLMGAMIGSLWLLPFLSVIGYCYSWGNTWFPLLDMGIHIFKADLFPGMIPAVSVVGFSGAFILLFRKQPLAFVVGLLGFLYIVIASRSVSNMLISIPGGSCLKSIEYQRFAMYAKVFLFIGAAYLIWLGWSFSVFRRSIGIKMFKGSGSSWCRKLGILAVNGCCAGLLFCQVVKPVAKNLMYENGRAEGMYSSRRSNQKARQKIAAWINSQKMNGSGFFRLGLSRSLGDANIHDYLDLGVLLDVPFFKMDYTPANFYKYKVASDDLFVLRAVNIRYVLSDRPMDPAQFCLVRQEGDLSVYELKAWDPHPFSVLDGKGEVELRAFDREEIVCSVGPGASGRLMIHVSPFPRWKATFNGKPIPIGIEVLDRDKKLAFMTVDLKHGSGTYELRFCRAWVEASALLLFVCGWILAGVTFFSAHFAGILTRFVGGLTAKSTAPDCDAVDPNPLQTTTTTRQNLPPQFDR